MQIITTHDKLECAKRELAYRRRVYRRMVENGRMREAFADRQIALMEAIFRDYEAKLEGERLI